MKGGGLILIAAFFALACGVLVKQLMDTWANGQPAPMPAFTLQDVTGAQRSSSEWQGKILIINFWATWCPPCRKEIPEFIAAQTELADQGVVFVGIAIDEEKAVKNFTEDMGINYSILIAGTTGADMAREFGDSMEAVPYTVIVNREGQMIFKKPGEISKTEILFTITPLLKQAK